MLADELQLPVCPITINGSFDVMPRTKDWSFPVWNRLRLTIHEPIQPKGKGSEFEKQTMVEAYKAVMSGLEEKYQGFIDNPEERNKIKTNEYQERLANGIVDGIVEYYK